MRPLERVEMWIALAQEAALIGPAYAFGAPAGLKDPVLEMKMAAARGLSRGLNYHQLPFTAWEAGKEFLALLDGLLNEDNVVAVRVGHVVDLVAASGRLVEDLRHSAARPRADLDD